MTVCDSFDTSTTGHSHSDSQRLDNVQTFALCNRPLWLKQIVTLYATLSAASVRGGDPAEDEGLGGGGGQGKSQASCPTHSASGVNRDRKARTFAPALACPDCDWKAGQPSISISRRLQAQAAAAAAVPSSSSFPPLLLSLFPRRYDYTCVLSSVQQCVPSLPDSQPSVACLCVPKPLMGQCVVPSHC